MGRSHTLLRPLDDMSLPDMPLLSLKITRLRCGSNCRASRHETNPNQSVEYPSRRTSHYCSNPLMRYAKAVSGGLPTRDSLHSSRTKHGEGYLLPSCRVGFLPGSESAVLRTAGGHRRWQRL